MAVSFIGGGNWMYLEKTDLSQVTDKLYHMTINVESVIAWCPTHIVLCFCFTSSCVPLLPYVASFSGS
jgi:hypothetical protein